MGEYPVMVARPPDALQRMVSYGRKKTLLPWKRLVLQAFVAGFWIGISGHISTGFGGSFYVGQPYSSAIAKTAYGLIFPVGFLAILLTGAELYTGNTAAMAVYVYDSKSWTAVIDLIKNWTVCLFLNLAGAVFVALFFSWATSTFENDEYIHTLCDKKMHLGWGAALIKGIGCNILVCIATFAAGAIDDAAGKILAVWVFISAFVLGGFEHVVANFFTLSLCAMLPLDITIGDVILRNWIPVWMGNTLAGALCTGLVWWYTLRPRVKTRNSSTVVVVDKMSDKAEVNEDSQVSTSEPSSMSE